MAIGIELLHYACQQAMVVEYETRLNAKVVIRKNRNGSLRWRMGSCKTEVNTLTAMERLNIALATAPARKAR